MIEVSFTRKEKFEGVGRDFHVGFLLLCVDHFVFLPLFV